jgi:hypothetical protein
MTLGEEGEEEGQRAFLLRLAVVELDVGLDIRVLLVARGNGIELLICSDMCVLVRGADTSLELGLGWRWRRRRILLLTLAQIA